MDPRPELCAAVVQPLDGMRDVTQRLFDRINRTAAYVAGGDAAEALRHLRAIQGLREELPALEDEIEAALLKVPGAARGALTVVSGGRR